jgi:hypothetical protein
VAGVTLQGQFTFRGRCSSDDPIVQSKGPQLAMHLNEISAPITRSSACVTGLAEARQAALEPGSLLFALIGIRGASGKSAPLLVKGDRADRTSTTTKRSVALTRSPQRRSPRAG